VSGCARGHPAKCPFTLNVSMLNISIAGCPKAEAEIGEVERKKREHK
jgi:hypothetical protein